MSITGEGPGRPPVKCGAPLTDITCRHSGRDGHPRCLRAPPQDRPGPDGRDLALRGRHRPDLLAVGDRARDRRGARPDGLGPPAQRPLPGLRDRRRLDRGRRQQRRLGSASSRCSARAELEDDPRFRDNAARMAHLAELEAALAPYFKRRTSEDCSPPRQAGVPAGPVNDMHQMQADPQVRARAMVVEVEHARLGTVRPWACRSSSPTPRAPSAPAPRCTASTPAKS